MEAEPAPFLLADPTATAEASTPAHEAVSSRSDEESPPSGALVSDPVEPAEEAPLEHAGEAPTEPAGKAPTGQGGEAERRAEEAAPVASELRRQTSFGSAADELERAIAEMRGRPEGRRAQDESERASS